MRRYQDDDHLLAEITAETKIILFEPAQQVPPMRQWMPRVG
ncbi:hypothetical protein [Shewanella profunda]|nr:hypothetical protein [Shewanella profunda]